MSELEPPMGHEPDGGVVVSASNEQVVVPIDLERWRSLAEEVLIGELGATGGAGIEMTLLFVDIETIALLNEEHLGTAGPTDVLSFPLDDPLAGTSTVPLLIGDVVICPEVAASNAPMHAGSLDDEVALLVVHGILHLLGHDHAEIDEATVMRRLETELLERCHWRGPTPAGFSFDHLD